MKTKISFLTLMVGVATFAMAQSASSGGGSAGGSGASTPAQTAPGMPAQGNNGQNQTMPSQNMPAGFGGNNGATNLTGMTNGPTVSTNSHHWWKWW